jgi:hypothetical protein
MNTATDAPLVHDELDLLADQVPLAGPASSNSAAAPPRWRARWCSALPTATSPALEVDERQHAKNLARRPTACSFVSGGAQAIPFPDASFDLALMLKSLHHVPRP